MFNAYKVCPSPFLYAHISANGDVHTCCPMYIKFPIGNIYKKSIGDIFNSERAQKLRQKILNNDYSFCKAQLCNNGSDSMPYECLYLNRREGFNKIMSGPSIVRFAHDYECNIHCITCRTKQIRNSNQQLRLLNDMIDSHWLPLLSTAQVLSLNGAGDTLASRHGRKLIMAAAHRYPDLKFNLHTNGLLCNAKMLEYLGIVDRCSVMQISLHAATRKTYDRIALGSDWDRVMTNVHWQADQLQAGRIDALFLFFVVSALNYREMPAFARMARDLGAHAFFWRYINWRAQTAEEAASLSVFLPEHPQYANLREILQDNIFTESHCHLQPLFIDISQGRNISNFVYTNPRTGRVQ